MVSSVSNIFNGRLFTWIAGDVRQSMTRIVDRRRFNRLLDLDDHMLNDIGVTRTDVLIASQLPLEKNAALELRRMSLERRRQCK